jgi:hypothetical protein
MFHLQNHSLDFDEIWYYGSAVIVAASEFNSGSYQLGMQPTLHIFVIKLFENCQKQLTV